MRPGLPSLRTKSSSFDTHPPFLRLSLRLVGSLYTGSVGMSDDTYATNRFAILRCIPFISTSSTMSHGTPVISGVLTNASHRCFDTTLLRNSMSFIKNGEHLKILHVYVEVLIEMFSAMHKRRHCHLIDTNYPEVLLGLVWKMVPEPAMEAVLKHLLCLLVVYNKSQYNTLVVKFLLFWLRLETHFTTHWSLMCWYCIYQFRMQGIT